MAVKFKVVEKGEPGVPGGGTKQFYARTVTQGEANISELTRSIEKISTVSGADIRAVLYAFVDVVKDDLAAGRIVRIGDLGSLRVIVGATLVVALTRLPLYCNKGNHTGCPYSVPIGMTTGAKM